MAESKQTLPPESDDKIVEVSLRHVVLAFGGIVISSLTVGTAIVVAKDFAKYKRQKAIIDAAQQLLLTLNPERSNSPLLWNENKTVVSTSRAKKSKK